MPDRWAVASGNWSNTATWNGGTLPTAADDVYADGYTVTIDQNVTVLSIRTTQRSGGTAGGGFILNSGLTLIADIRAGTTTCLTRTALGASSSIVGNIYGSDTTSSTAGVSTGGTSTLIITGTITPGLNAGGTALSCGTSTVTFNGNVSNRTNTNAYAIYAGGSPLNLTINGNVHPVGAGSSSPGIAWQGTGTLTVNGYLRGSDSGSSSHGLWQNAGSATVVVNGNLLGGASTNGISGANTTAVIYGDAIANAAAAFSGLQCTVYGNCTAGSLGTIPVSGRLLLNPSGTIQHSYPTNVAGSPSTFRSLYTGGVNLNQPAVTNVRSGIVYGASNEFTGTCAVPPAGSVALGVPVDNTTGTASITAANIRAAIGLASANLDTQLSGLATDIDNITVDNAAIASAVRTNLSTELARIDVATSTRLASASYTAPPAAGTVADAVWDESYSSHNTAGSFGKLLNIIRKSNLSIEGVISNSITPTTTTFASDVAATTGAYEHSVLLFVSGSLAGENSPIVSYNAVNGVFLLEEPLTAAPSAGDEFVVIANTHVHSVADIQAGLASSGDAQDILDAIDAIDPSAVTVTPLSSVKPVKVKGTNIETYTQDTDPIRMPVWSGASGNTPVDLESMRPLVLVIADKTSKEVIQQVEDGDITIDTTNYFTFTPSVTAVSQEGIHRYTLRKATGSKEVLARGDFQVFWEPEAE